MLITSYAQLIEFHKWLASKDELAFDIETAPTDLTKPEQAVNPRQGQVIGFAISDNSASFYLAHKHLVNGEFKDYLSKSQCVAVLEKLKTKKLITFNGSFDVRFTHAYFGVNLAPSIYSEAQLARHTANEESDSWKGLKAEGAALFGAQETDQVDKLTAEIEAAGGAKGHVWLGSLSTVAEYAEQDVNLTLKVNKHYVDLLTADGLADFYYNEEVMPCYRYVTIPLEANGVAVDLALIQQTQREMQSDLDRLDAEIRLLIAPHRAKFDQWWKNKEFPVKQTGPFVQQLVKHYGLELPRTPGGNYSLNAKAISSLPPDSEFRLFMESKCQLPSSVVESVQQMLQGSQDQFNINSKPHWSKIFFDQLDEKPLSYTEKTKKPQIDDSFLSSVRGKYPFVQALLDYNRITKLKGTYVDRYALETDGGRFYARFSQHVTTTGRMSSDLQQLPKKVDPEDDQSTDSQLVRGYVNRIRDFFIAPKGSVLVGADYSALEVVIFADDAGDDTLLEMVRRKYDPYSQGAIDVWKLTDYSADKRAPNFLKLHKPQLRQDSKEWFLGLRYGMGSYKLSKTLNISEKEAEGISKRYFEAYPRLRSRMDSILQSAQSQGFVVSKGGRRRRVPLLAKLHTMHSKDFQNSLRLWEKYSDNPKVYDEMKYLKRQYWGMVNTVLNFPIQSMAATVVTKASVELAKQIEQRGLKAKLIMTIHDEICLEVAESDADKVADLMRHIMENTTKLTVPLTAVPVIGRRYGDLK